MASLKAIRRRIASVKSTQQITRAVKLISAARLRRAQEALTNALPYSQALARVAKNAAAYEKMAGIIEAIAQRLRHGRRQAGRREKGAADRAGAGIEAQELLRLRRVADRQAAQVPVIKVEEEGRAGREQEARQGEQQTGGVPRAGHHDGVRTAVERGQEQVDCSPGDPCHESAALSGVSCTRDAATFPRIRQPSRQEAAVSRIFS